MFDKPLSFMELNREADDEHLKTLEKAVKNKFRWHWLETTVEITLKGERKATSLIEWIRKIDMPGKAKCIVCDKIISYGARGRISLTEHCKSNEHAEKLKIKADNYTLFFFFFFLFVSSIVRNLHSYKSPYITTWHGCTRIYNIIIMWLLHFFKVN